jgi:hypothetical protein
MLHHSGAHFGRLLRQRVSAEMARASLVELAAARAGLADAERQRASLTVPG